MRKVVRFRRPNCRRGYHRPAGFTSEAISLIAACGFARHHLPDLSEAPGSEHQDAENEQYGAASLGIISTTGKEKGLSSVTDKSPLCTQL